MVVMVGLLEIVGMDQAKIRGLESHHPLQINPKLTLSKKVNYY
jgi:hypothetical protein